MPDNQQQVVAFPDCGAMEWRAAIRTGRIAGFLIQVHPDK